MEPRKILILSLIANTIGDNVLLTPVFTAVKKRYPQAQLHVTVSSINKYLFENHPMIDRLIVVPELRTIAKRIPRWKKVSTYAKMFFRLARGMKKQKYDMCFILEPDFAPNQLLPRLCGIKKSYGWSYKGSIFSRFLTKTVQHQSLAETNCQLRHFIEAYFDVLHLANIKTPKKPITEVFTSTKVEKQAKEKLKRLGVKSKYIIIQPLGKFNRWGAERFGRIAKGIVKKYKYDVCVLGSPAQKEHCGKIKTVGGKGVFSLAAKTKLEELPAIIKNAQFSVTVDSGLMHLSAAVATPVVAIFGRHSPKHSRAFGKAKIISLYKDIGCNPSDTCAQCPRCFTSITEKEVEKAITELHK